MAQRTLVPMFWDDEDVTKLTVQERLLMICMITDVSLSDDFGNLPANPKTLKKHAFGYDEDISISQVLKWRNNILANCRNFKLYTVNGQEYITMLNFQQHQDLRYQRKTNIPEPPSDIGDTEEAEPEVAEQPEPEIKDSDNVPNNFEKLPENYGNLPENYEKFPLSRVELNCIELDRVELNSGAAISEKPPDAPLSPNTDKPKPELKVYSFKQPPPSKMPNLPEYTDMPPNEKARFDNLLFQAWASIVKHQPSVDEADGIRTLMRNHGAQAVFDKLKEHKDDERLKINGIIREFYHERMGRQPAPAEPSLVTGTT